MIEAGALENPSPEAIFAVHTGPWEVGHIVCPLGVGLTGWDTFEARIEAETDFESIVQEAAQAIAGVSTVKPLMSLEQFKPLFNEVLLEDGPYKDFIFIQLGGAARHGRSLGGGNPFGYGPSRRPRELRSRAQADPFGSYEGHPRSSRV